MEMRCEKRGKQLAGGAGPAMSNRPTRCSDGWTPGRLGRWAPVRVYGAPRSRSVRSGQQRAERRDGDAVITTGDDQAARPFDEVLHLEVDDRLTVIAATAEITPPADDWNTACGCPTDLCRRARVDVGSVKDGEHSI